MGQQLTPFQAQQMQNFQLRNALTAAQLAPQLRQPTQEGFLPNVVTSFTDALLQERRQRQFLDMMRQQQEALLAQQQQQGQLRQQQLQQTVQAFQRAGLSPELAYLGASNEKIAQDLAESLQQQSVRVGQRQQQQESLSSLAKTQGLSPEAQAILAIKAVNPDLAVNDIVSTLGFQGQQNKTNAEIANLLGTLGLTQAQTQTQGTVQQKNIAEAGRTKSQDQEIRLGLENMTQLLSGNKDVGEAAIVQALLGNNLGSIGGKGKLFQSLGKLEQQRPGTTASRLEKARVDAEQAQTNNASVNALLQQAQQQAGNLLSNFQQSRLGGPVSQGVGSLFNLATIPQQNALEQAGRFGDLINELFFTPVQQQQVPTAPLPPLVSPERPEVIGSRG